MNRRRSMGLIAEAASAVALLACSSAPFSDEAAGARGGGPVVTPVTETIGPSVGPTSAVPVAPSDVPGATPRRTLDDPQETGSDQTPVDTKTSSEVNGAFSTACDVRSRRIWKLTPDQLERTVLSLLPHSKLSLDVLSGTITAAQGGFSNLAEAQVLSAPYVKQLAVLADQFAEELVTERADWAPCLESEVPGGPCLRAFVAEFLKRAFRRPSETTEVERYADFFARQTEERGEGKALRQLARAVFLSPSFQFRTELGDSAMGVSSMTSYERASALAYGVADGPPDARLMRVAAGGALTTSEQLEEQVRRLLSVSGSGRGITKFLLEHFGIKRALRAKKNDQVFPDWHWGLAVQLVNESTAFFDEVLWRDDARFSTLLTADYSMLTDAIAPIYGLDSLGTSEHRRRIMPTGQRSGVLTQAAFLASLGGFSAPDITQRGHFLRTVVMCQELPTPAEGVPPIPTVEGLSRRERLEKAHLENVSCQGCHRLMDPLGFTLENYDSVGGWRTVERVGRMDVPLNARGTLVGSTKGELAIQGAQELGQVLAGLPEVQACFVKKLSEYIGGGQHAADACRVAQASETFRATDGDIIEAVVALLADEQSYLRGD